MAIPSRAPDLPAPFGKYLLCERIGKGGMAEIFRATVHGASGFLKELVIKRMLPSLTHDPGFADVIVREAKIAVTLRHQNIVQVFELGEVDGQYYIAMEYMHGRDLRAVLSRCAEMGRQMPIGLAVHIGLEVCRALDYAHSVKGAGGKALELVHRDISPTNLMASFAGEVKVLDFGIAKAEVAEYVTREGLIKGNCPYMSPEQIAGRSVDHRSDLFSLGSTLYELLTGRRAFEAPTQIAIMQRIYAEPCEPPSKHRADISTPLDDVVMKLLTKEPDKRYQDAAATHDALSSLAGKEFPASSSFELATFLRELFGDEARAEMRALPPEGETGQSPAIRVSAAVVPEIVVGEPLASDDDGSGETRPMPLRPSSVPSPPSVLEPDERKRTTTRPMAERLSPIAQSSPAQEAVPPTPTTPPYSPARKRLLVGAALGAAGLVAWALIPGLGGQTAAEYEIRPDRRSFDIVRPPPELPPPTQDQEPDALPDPVPPDIEVPQHPEKVRNLVAAPMGKLRLGSQPWAYVTIDGRRVPKETPLIDYPIPAGAHRITLSHPGFRTVRMVLRVAPGETFMRHVELERE